MIRVSWPPSRTHHPPNLALLTLSRALCPRPLTGQESPHRRPHYNFLGLQKALSAGSAAVLTAHRLRRPLCRLLNGIGARS